jgi:TRAP-type C4-dicarboxylate transport system permease small subunit
MNTESSIQSSLSKLNKTLAYIAGIGFFLIMFITVYEVIGRYFFKSPTMWTFETTGYILIVSAFLSASYTLETGGHISIDLVPMYLKPGPKKVLAVIADILGIIFVSLWLWKSTALTINCFTLNWVSRTQMEVPLWPFYAIVPLGLLLLLIQYIVMLVRTITRNDIVTTVIEDEE